MKTPTREHVRELLHALRTRNKSQTPARTDLAITAIYLLINEGIDPSAAARVRYRNVNFLKCWVEFIPGKGHDVVRRPLSEETLMFLNAKRRRTKSGPDDLLCPFTPGPMKSRKKDKPIGRYAAAYLSFEIAQAGCNVKLLSATSLKWIWVDEHPQLRDQERIAAILAHFALTWGKDFQQESLLQRIFNNTPVLRPSWAYPKWHKNFVMDGAEPTPTGI